MVGCIIVNTKGQCNYYPILCESGVMQFIRSTRLKIRLEQQDLEGAHF